LNDLIQVQLTVNCFQSKNEAIIISLEKVVKVQQELKMWDSKWYSPTFAATTILIAYSNWDTAMAWLLIQCQT